MPDAVMGTARGAGISLLQLFKASVEHTKTASDDKVFCPPFHPTFTQYAACEKAVNKKRQLSTRSPAESLNSVTLPQNIPTLKRHTVFGASAFSRWAYMGTHKRVRSVIEPQYLGSSHPCYILCPPPQKTDQPTLNLSRS